MRVIKFRVVKDGKVIGYEMLESGTWFASAKGQDWENATYSGEGLVRQQYIGILDKNKKEIYEGDITNYGEVKFFKDLNWDSGGSIHPGFYFSDVGYGTESGELDYHTGFDEDVEIIDSINKEFHGN